MHEANVRRHQLGLVRVGDRVYAFRGTCPHRGSPLARGWVRAHVSGGLSGPVKVDQLRPVLTCPWHNWEYDLATGRALFDHACRMVVYDVEVVDGRVQLGAPRSRKRT